MGTLLHSCAKVREPILLSFRVIIVVGPIIGVLDGGQYAARGKGVWEVLGVFPICFNGALLSRNLLD